MTEPTNADELFAPCPDCARATRPLVLGAIVAGALIGAGVAWVVFGRKA